MIVRGAPVSGRLVARLGPWWLMVSGILTVPEATEPGELVQ
ncbi:MAG: hypothetical protein ACJ780_13150 [Solirubrobacteraceae bacterium]